MNILKKLFETNVSFAEDENLTVMFGDYFSEENRDYNKFALDEKEDIDRLVSFAARLREKDSSLKAYVCTYGCESTDIHGGKWVYADSVWSDTALPLSDIEEMLESSGVEPSGTGYVKNCHYADNTLLALQDGEDKVKLVPIGCAGNIINLYRD